MKLKVVIPCRNEAQFIENCLDSVIAACEELHDSYEIMVIDGKSDDGTIDILERYCERNSHVHIVVNEKQLTPFAFNLGILSGEPAKFVAIVGGRHILDKSYFTIGLETLEQHPDTWCVGGTVKNTFVNEYGEMVAAAMSTSFGMGLGNFRTKTESGFVDTIGTPIYPAFVFEKIGLFDEQLLRNQDDEYNFRVLKAGGKIYHNAEIEVEYFVRADPKGLRRQMMQYGYWKVFVNRKHRAVTTFRQLIPPLFVLFLFSLPLAFFPIPYVGLVQSFLLAAYMVLCIVFGNKLGKTRVQQSQIAAIFPTLHISYGWGYLKGIWRFLILRKNPEESASKLSR